jgi:hypothetical protein
MLLAEKFVAKLRHLRSTIEEAAKGFGTCFQDCGMPVKKQKKLLLVRHDFLKPAHHGNPPSAGLSGFAPKWGFYASSFESRMASPAVA